MMGDLLEYFEERARVLDSMAPTIQTSAAMYNPNFISCITFNGIPILPPVLTARRREEMQEYKRQAMRHDYKRKTRQREQMNVRLSSLVKDVEEKKASRWTEPKQLEEQEIPTRDITPKTQQHRKLPVNPAVDGQTVKAKVERPSRPVEVKSKIPATACRRHRSGSQESDEEVKSEMTVLKKTRRRRTNSEGEKDIPKSEPIKSKQKLPIPVPDKRQKKSSASPKTKTVTRSGNSIETLRRSSSLSSLPNLAKIQGVNALAIPKPPSSQMTEQQQLRQLSLRHYSNSQPDLRTLSAEGINFSPPTRRSHSKDDISSLENSGIGSMSQDHSMSNTDLPQSSSSSNTKKDQAGVNDKKSVKDSTQGNVQDNKHVLNQKVDSKKLNVGAKSKGKTESDSTKQVISSTKKEAEQTQNSSQTGSRNRRTSGQSETTGSGTSSEFPSLEGCNSLPHEIDGLRFTSVRQQHIGHTLDKLSKVLNMEETLSTLNSTSSNEIQENIARLRQSVQSSQAASSAQSSIQSRQSFERVSGRRNNISPQTDIHKSTETPSPKTSDSSAPASTPSSAEQSFGSNTSGSSNTSHSRASVTAASIKSSTSSVKGGQSGGAPVRRMSPKGLKNTVHFDPLVTEISTSASQSLEDKISVRKLDVTPTNSIQFGSDEQGQISQTQQGRTSDSGTLPSSVRVTIPSSESMLSKVALSPDADSPQTPVDCPIKNMPFETYGQSIEGEINTSDKENEIRVKPQGRTEMPGRPANASARVKVDQLLIKSQNSDDGSQTSTLKGSQDLLGERISGRPDDSHESQSSERVRNVVTTQGQQTRASNVDPRIAAQSRPQLGKGTHDTQRLEKESSHPTIRGNMPVNISGRPTHDHVSQKIYELHQDTKKEVSHPVSYQHAPPILTHPVAHTHSGYYSQVPNTKAAERSGSKGVQRKLNMDAGSEFIPSKNAPGDSDGEREAKAEHIQKYLNHVQRHSLEGDADSTEVPKHSDVKKSSPSSPFDIRSTIQSFTSSLQSLSQADEEELLRIQAEHFDKLRRHLIEQQKQQLEELFVHQRREQMVLQTDIEKYQNQLQEQEEFLTKNSASYNSLPGNQQQPTTYRHQPQENRNNLSHSQSDHPPQHQTHLQPNILSNSHSNSYSQPTSNSHSFSQSDSHSYSHPQLNTQSQSYSQFNIQPDLHHQPHLNPQQPNPQQPPIPSHTNIPQQPDPAYQAHQQSYPYLEQYVQRRNLPSGHTQQDHAPYNAAYLPDHGSYPQGPTHAYGNVSHQAPAPGQPKYVHQSNYHHPVDIQDPNYFRQPSTQHPTSNTIHHQDPPPPKYSQHNPHRLPGPPYNSQENIRDPRYASSNPHDQQGESYQSPPHDDANTSHQYSYVPSPSLYYNPRDNGSDISTFSKATPKQSLTFNNHSTPTPKVHKPVLRSPVKQPSLPVSDQHVIVPDYATNAKLKRCFDRVSACAKGYLTRRLLRTEKVQEVLKTIKDTKDFAWQFQAETPIKRGDFSNSDRHLLDRIIAQLQAALLDIHEIFFEIPVWERMSLIAQSRQAKEERRLRESTGTRSSVSSSHPRISSATLKAIERKRKQEEEVAMSVDSRPRSAPPPAGNTAPPSSYSNVPSQTGAAAQSRINSQNNVRPNATNMDQRALKPLQGQGQSSQGQTSRITTRPKERPKTASNQTSGNTATHPYLIAKSKKSSIPAVRDKPTSTNKSSGTSSTTTTTAKNKPVGSKIKPKITDKSSKAWRG